jgi:hypothetical protein
MCRDDPLAAAISDDLFLPVEVFPDTAVHLAQAVVLKLPKPPVILRELSRLSTAVVAQTTPDTLGHWLLQKKKPPGVLGSSG